MAFDIQGARKEGYSESEIADYLASQKKFDAAGARKEGYSDDEIVSYLSTSAPKKQEPNLLERAGSAIKKAVSGPSSVMDGVPSSTPPVDERLSLGQGPISQEALQKARDVREGLVKPQDQQAGVLRVAKALEQKQEPTFSGLVNRVMEPERIQAEAEAAETTKARKTLARDNYLLSSLGSGLATATSGGINTPSVAADFFNQSFVNPVLTAVGLEPMARAPTMYGTEYLAKAADEFMPSVGKQKLGEAFDKGEATQWLFSNLAANSPSVAMSLAGAFSPALRAAVLPAMGAAAAGTSFAAGDDSRVAVAKGAVEAVTEMLPLGVFDKVGDLLRGMSLPKQKTILAVAGQRLAQAGVDLTAVGLTNAIEETAAQFGGNVLDKYFQGKDVELTDNLTEAAVLGAATGVGMSAPRALGTLAGRDQVATPDQQIADIINQNVANARSVGIDAAVLRGMSVNQDRDQATSDLQQATSAGDAIAAAERLAGDTTDILSATPAMNMPAGAYAPAATASLGSLPAPDVNYGGLPVSTGLVGSQLPPDTAGIDLELEQKYGLDKLRQTSQEASGEAVAPLSIGSLTPTSLTAPSEGTQNVNTGFQQGTVPPQSGITETLPDTGVDEVARLAADDTARADTQKIIDDYAAATGTDRWELKAPTKPDQQATVNAIADAIGSQFGGRVVAYEDTGDMSHNGFAVRNIAFVNVASNLGVAQTSLHEFKHTVEQIAAAETRQGLTDTPAQQFTQKIEGLFDEMTDAGKRAYLTNFLAADELAGITDPADKEARIQELLVDPVTRSEMTADFLGNRATDKKFWLDVAKADPAGFKGFVNTWLGIIDNLISTLKGSKTRDSKESVKVDKYLRDLNKAKMVAREALIAYRKTTMPQAASQQGQLSPSAKQADVPTYGKPREGAVSVIGRHYSPKQQTSLSGGYYGTGIKGAEIDRLRESRDPRLKSRVYFYVDTGSGIRPEAGVGRYAHEVRLDNIYDPKTGLVPKKESQNAFESAVINAGFDGYLAPFGKGAAVVLLGPKHKAVPVTPVETAGEEKASAPAQPTTLKKALMGKELENVRAENIPNARVRMGNLEIPSDQVEAANRELERVGAEVRFSKQEAEPSKRQYKLELEKQERKVSEEAGLSDEEEAVLLQDAAELNLSEEETAKFLEQARDVKKQFPVSDGWAPIELTGLEMPEAKDGKKPKVSLKWKDIAYNFNRPPNKTRAPTKMDEAWAGKVADKFYDLVKGIYSRGEAGDKNAQIIISHQTWYRNVAEILRREYGAQGDLLADLLGATSPNTPVDTNWRFSVDILRRFTRGDFDRDLAKFQRYVDNGGRVSDYPASDKIRQISGKLYGMNSGNAQLALLSMWRNIETGSAPKARNFALNLIGQSNMATIDVWAARMLRRAANLIEGSDLPRIPPPAEKGVTGKWNSDVSAVTGEFGFGAYVMDRVSEKLKADGIDVTAPDLQAIAWFAEKELWGQNQWTTAAGEGGSFEENIEATPTERYVAGWSIQQGERVPDPAAVSLAQSRVLAMLTGDDSVVAARVIPTKGLYGNTVEESFDTEWTVEKANHDPSMAMAEIAKLAQENEQYDIFVSRVIAPSENNENARPGVEIYFRTTKDLDAAMPVLEKFTARGQDGFTMAVDPRSKTGGKYVGVRLQYVPEISARWDEATRAELLSEGGVERLLKEKFELLNDIAAEVSSMDGVAYASVQRYDTVVVGKENYDEYINRAATEGDNSPRGEVWFGQPVRQAIERAVARYEGKLGQVGKGRVPSAGGGLQPALSARQRGEETKREKPQVTSAGLESLFERLNGRGLKRTRAQAAAAARPDATKINYVQDNFLDILEKLEDSGKVKINCD